MKQQLLTRQWYVATMMAPAATPRRPMINGLDRKCRCASPSIVERRRVGGGGCCKEIGEVKLALIDNNVHNNVDKTMASFY